MLLKWKADSRELPEVNWPRFSLRGCCATRIFGDFLSRKELLFREWLKHSKQLSSWVKFILGKSGCFWRAHRSTRSRTHTILSQVLLDSLLSVQCCCGCCCSCCCCCCYKLCFLLFLCFLCFLLFLLFLFFLFFLLFLLLLLLFGLGTCESGQMSMTFFFVAWEEDVSAQLVSSSSTTGFLQKELCTYLVLLSTIRQPLTELVWNTPLFSALFRDGPMNRFGICSFHNVLYFAVLLKVLPSADVFHHMSIMISPSEPGQSPIQRLVMQELAAQLVSKTNCLVHMSTFLFDTISWFFSVQIAGVAGARSPKRVNGSAIAKDACAGSGLRSPDH